MSKAKKIVPQPQARQVQSAEEALVALWSSLLQRAKEGDMTAIDAIVGGPTQEIVDAYAKFYGPNVIPFGSTHWRKAA